MRYERDSIIKDDEVSGWQAPGQVQRSYKRQPRRARRRRFTFSGRKMLSMAGNAVKRQPRRIHRRRRRFTLDRRKVLLIVSCAVLIYSVAQLGAWGLRALNTYNTNAQLQAMRDEALSSAAAVTQQPVMTPYPSETPTPTATPAVVAAQADPQRTPVSLVTATPIPQSMLFFQTAGAMLPEMEKLYQQNSDLVGWITIPGVVDLPVVYRDNSYYLTRDFYKKSSKGGTLFLDENHPIERTTQHLVIHGHNMTDGSMFGLLAHYRNKNYLLEHGIVNFSTLYQKDAYVIFAVAVTPEDVYADDFIPFIGTKTFTSKENFDWYMDKVRDGMLYQVYMDVQYTDALLTLSTCLDDDRLLLVCRRLREGETVESVRRLQRLSVE